MHVDGRKSRRGTGEVASRGPTVTRVFNPRNDWQTQFHEGIKVLDPAAVEPVHVHSPDDDARSVPLGEPLESDVARARRGRPETVSATPTRGATGIYARPRTRTRAGGLPPRARVP